MRNFNPSAIFLSARKVDKARRLDQAHPVSASPLKPSTTRPAPAASSELETEIQSLLHSAHLYRTLFDGLPGMAYLGRPDHERTMDLVSAGSRLLLGLKHADRAFQLAPLIHPDDRALVLEHLHTAVAEQRPYAVEYRLRHSQGSWRTVWDQGRPLQLGQQTCLQGHIVDITQRLRRERERLDAEHQLNHSQKFSALNKLAGGTAHEFNNIVAGILGSAELLAMDIPAETPLYESLKHIFEASNNAREFVQKIRQFAQRPAPERKPDRLQPMIEDCLQILRSVIPPEKVEIQTHVDAGCPKVHMDTLQIHQTLIDLCLQAWQLLADRRGRIRIVLESCTLGQPGQPAVGSLRPGRYARLTVRDNSPGLAPTACERIFDPFYLRKSTGKKIGLELFQVRETILAHQGEILVESEPGKGMAYHIYLPIVEESPSLPPATQ